MAEHQFNFRLAENYYKKLIDLSEKEGKKPSTLVSEIIKGDLDFWYEKRKRRDIPVPAQILRTYMEMIDVKNIKEESIDFIANFIYYEIQTQIGTLTFKELKKRIIQFNLSLGFKIGVFAEDSEDYDFETVKFFGQIPLGYNYNYIHAKIYSKLFERLQLTVLHIFYDDLGYVLTLKKSKNIQ